MALCPRQHLEHADRILGCVRAGWPGRGERLAWRDHRGPRVHRHGPVRTAQDADDRRSGRPQRPGACSGRHGPRRLVERVRHALVRGRLDSLQRSAAHTLARRKPVVAVHGAASGHRPAWPRHRGLPWRLGHVRHRGISARRRTQLPGPVAARLETEPVLQEVLLARNVDGRLQALARAGRRFLLGLGLRRPGAVRAYGRPACPAAERRLELDHRPQGQETGSGHARLRRLPGRRHGVGRACSQR